MAIPTDSAKPKNKSGGRLYIPVVGIISSVLSLVIVLIVFSSRSIHREGSMVKRFLKREGITLMNSLEAAARTGTGLGLAVVHRVVEAHNGTVRFDSRPGEGTTVQITLPPESSLSSSLSM